MPTVNIITPIYNSAKTLPAYFDSLKKQTYQDYQVLLIDDGSTDNSADLCQTYAKKDSRFKLTQRSHEGVSATKNYGIKIATAKYLSFIDSDDTVEPTFLETLVEKLEKNHADLSCCGYQEITNGKVTHSMHREKVKQNPYLEILKNYQGFLANKLYKRDIITSKNLTIKNDLSMCGDLLFNFQYLEHCKKIAYSDKNLYNYHINSAGLSRDYKKTWFDILTVYNILLKDLPNFSHPTQDYLKYNYLIAISEAKMRCQIMNLNFKNIQKEYHIENIKETYYHLQKSPYLTKKEKLRLFFFIKFNGLAKIIKFRRLK